MRQFPSVRLGLMIALALASLLALGAQAAPGAQGPGADQSTALPARVAVVHAAPFAAGDATVTVVANDAFLLDNDFRFGEFLSYISLPAGSYKIEVFVGSLTLEQSATATPAIVETLALAAGQDYTVAAIGTNTSSYPLDLLVLNDDNNPPASATAKLRVVHAAPFDPAGPSSTGIDVVPDAGGAAVVTNLVYANATGYLTLPSGVSFNLKVVRTGQTTPTLIDLPALTLNAGQIVTVLAIGGANGQTASALVLPAPQRAPAQVRIVHAAPFATGEAPVTVALNGLAVVSGLGFKDVFGYAEVQPNLYLAQIYVGNSVSGTPALSQALALQDGQRYTLVAIGTNTTTYPLRLLVLDDDVTPPASAAGLLRVVHAAPFTSTVAATAIDVVPDAGGTPIITGLQFGNVSSYLTLPSGTAINLKVVPSGQTTPTLIDLPALTLSAGQVSTVIAVGGANGQGLTALVLNDLRNDYRVFLPFIPNKPTV